MITKIKKNPKIIISLILVVILTFSGLFILLSQGDEGGGAILPPSNVEAHAAYHQFTREEILVSPGDGVNHLSVSQALEERVPREGYTLAPTIFGINGIDTFSSFVLRTSGGYNIDHPEISIDGQPAPTIERYNIDTFIITPLVPLTSNQVYVFRLGREEVADITWAFQVAPEFEITATLPAHQSTNVPVATGIEVTFSMGEGINIEPYFSIYPYVEGSFIYRDSTAIFMPTNPLREGQIYNVTIHGGISLPDSSHIISTDHVFSFETTFDQATTGNWESGVHFSSTMIESPSFIEPSVGFWLSYNRDGRRPSINMDVYRIDDIETAIDITNQLVDIPHWSLFSQVQPLADTSSLTRISSTTVNERQGDCDWDETFTLSNILPSGFYLLVANTGTGYSQMIIQVTDLAVQVIGDEDRTLLWVNDMTTGQPVSNGQVLDPISRRTYETSEYGIAVLERPLLAREYLIINTDEGKEGIVFINFVNIQPFPGGWGRSEPVPWTEPWGRSFGGDWGFSGQSGNSDYWTALQLDRTLFQRADTLSFWGFVQNRRQEEEISHVTAVLTEHSWWHTPKSDTLHRQNVPVAYGAYWGEVNLPHLEPGSYELAIYHGDIRLSSMFFRVEDYVTPPYRLTVSPSHNAVFAGEEVTFTARTEFFEGTPVPDLDLSYSLWGWELTGGTSGSRQTDGEGIIEITTTPNPENTNVAGERWLEFSAEATLPEIGWTHQWANIRVFVNDIHMTGNSQVEGEEASLTVDVHNITLDRINDGTNESWDDFLDTPVEGQTIAVEILEIYWEAIREGERYCHVTRQVIPRYRYERRERSVEHFELITDSQGRVTRDLQLPNRENASYQARLTTTDGNGRQIEENVFIGRDWSWFFWNAEDDGLFLDGASEGGYSVGDQVELTIMQGTEAVTQGNFLFVIVQDGIFSYHLGTNPLTFTFSEEHIPNVRVVAYHFNGHTYYSGWNMSQRLHFYDPDRKLEIHVTTYQETFKPGEAVDVTVTTTDTDGNPVPANVNVSLVDEALLALMDYEVDTFQMLYAHVGDNLRVDMATHRTFVSDGISDMMTGVATPQEGESFRFFNDAPMMAVEEAEAVVSDGYGGGAGTTIRERFEDTAIFASLRTDRRGQGSFTFQLPDNITSWRVTASGISNDLHAGNTVNSLIVSQPMFLHYTLNSTFLVGDTPYLGVNAYGSSLLGGEEVLFEVWREEAPDDIRTATGVAFERVNIPLWEKTQEGFYGLVIQATVGEYQDAVRHSYQVLRSHRQVETALFYEVTTETVFEVSSYGLTNITFMDAGQGQFLNDLVGMRHIWRNGARVEGLVAKREATRLIETHFPQISLFPTVNPFDVLDYQTEEGGIAILPYGQADLLTTVSILPFILDDVNTVALRDYLYNIFQTSTTENRVHALYGLALLGEPVLLELQNYALLTDLPIRDVTYVALGLVALGEFHTARELYNQQIAPYLQAIAPYYRINTGGDRQEMLETTSIVALLAAHLGEPESIGLHNYSMRHRRFNPVLNLERLAFIQAQMGNHTAQTPTITYTLFGETITRELDHGEQFTLRIPAQEIDEFHLVNITGEVGAVSIVSVPLEEMEAVEAGVTIRRDFFLAGSNLSTTTFEQGDLVRVQLTIDYSPEALTGSYVITDFLPAGLVHVSSSARTPDRSGTPGWWTHVQAEGQRVTFFDFNGRFRDNNIYYFYARVVNPGTFLAEGTIVQSFGAREYMVVGDSVVVTVKP
jgi:hypothetical protein